VDRQQNDRLGRNRRQQRFEHRRAILRGYSNSDTHANTYSDSDGHSYGYSNTNGNADTNAHFDTLPHARGSDGTKGNRCDCQQLYRELEQRKRCDRLSVGRIHKPLFYHLRTPLSGFGRRKHDQLPRDRVKCGDNLLLPITGLQWELYKPQFQRHEGKDE
jgi:hypothetical protein